MGNTKVILTPLKDGEGGNMIALLRYEKLSYKDGETCLRWHTFSKPTYDLIPG